MHVANERVRSAWFVGTMVLLALVAVTVPFAAGFMVFEHFLPW
jgi:hypothetical protein